MLIRMRMAFRPKAIQGGRERCVSRNVQGRNRNGDRRRWAKLLVWCLLDAPFSKVGEQSPAAP